MTTKVSVDAHAGWPVSVMLISIAPDGKQTDEREVGVPPHTKHDVYVHDGVQLHIRELPMVKEAQIGT